MVMVENLVILHAPERSEKNWSAMAARQFLNKSRTLMPRQYDEPVRARRAVQDFGISRCSLRDYVPV
jgi:hypothetical protein